MKQIDRNHQAREVKSENIKAYPKYLFFTLLSVLITTLFFTVQSKYIMSLEIKFFSYIMPLLVGVIFGILLAKIQLMNQRLKILANTDPLTGLYNRYRFHEFFTNEFKISKRYKIDLSLILLDIDNFKQINDQFGHRTGDQALKDISQIIKLNSRLTDIASRWGGEEFLILLPHTNKEGARILSERLRLSIANFNFHGLDTVTCSFGIAEFDPDQDTESDIIKKADAALYEAKRSGKNRVALAGSTPGD